MVTLTVKVPKLNQRSFPVDSFGDKRNIVGVVKDKYEFEGEIERTNALGDWYKDRQGYYYWGGGLQTKAAASVGNFDIPFDPVKMSWGHDYCQIPFIWNDLQTFGEQVTVAVIDTGIDHTHSELASNIHPDSISLVNNPTGKKFRDDPASIADSDGHGTQMAGIIGARGNGRVYGVAPNVKLLVIKATETGAVLPRNIKLFAEAVNYAASIAEVDIVSISYAFSLDDSNLITAVDNCLAKDKIVVAPIGNTRNSSKTIDGNRFPANYPGCLAIGSFDPRGNLTTVSAWNNKMRAFGMLAPGDDTVLTTSLNNSINPNGAFTSIATAFAAGALALMVSYAKQHSKNVAHCAGFLVGTCDDLGETIGPDEKTGSGRMNLRNAISKLKIQ
ncbi:S8 family peptidase [Dyadobacter bucti]|uniref:S8 family peptidase n=1 Tax=Dyadobacter bucti TaxID=2572203 RepID=UPI003F728D98